MHIVNADITLIKVWLEVGMEEQERRFAARVDDPLRQWKLSPMDVESYTRWYDYSRARDAMLKATDSKHAPWSIVRTDDAVSADVRRTIQGGASRWRSALCTLSISNDE